MCLAASALSGLAGHGHDPLGARDAITRWTHGGHAAPPQKKNILLYGGGALAQILRADGYAVSGPARDSALPAELTRYGEIWRFAAGVPTNGEVARLVAYVRSGHGLLLTAGQSDAADQADLAIVNALVTRHLMAVPQPKSTLPGALGGRTCARSAGHGTGVAVWSGPEVAGGGRIALLVNPVDGYPVGGCLARNLASFLAGAPVGTGH